MNTLDWRIQVISALMEGCSIRATERLTGVHQDTIMRLGAGIGDWCTHDLRYCSPPWWVQVNCRRCSHV